MCQGLEWVNRSRCEERWPEPEQSGISTHQTHRMPNWTLVLSLVSHSLVWFSP